jgi:hypothetical protein
MDRKKFFRIVLALVLLSIGMFAGMVVRFNSLVTPKVVHRSVGRNALWLRHSWVGENKSDDEYRKLADRLRELRISDAFFHVGPMTADGTVLNEKYPYAEQLLTALKLYYPTLHVEAWIGQVEKKGGGPLDISKDSIRVNIVKTAESFLDLGFDGIHYNIEPIYSGDKDILDLLKRTSEVTKSREKILSLATDELEPFIGADKLARTFSSRAGFWSRDYYQEVAKYTDQIAVMMYDTALPYPNMFSNFTAWETYNLRNLLPSNTVLFMGIPTYDDKRWSFHSKAENMSSGILGIRAGLERVKGDSLNNFGTAVYAEWTTDEKEWQTYEKEWLGK